MCIENYFCRELEMKAVRNVLSSKAPQSCTSLSFSFTHPKLLLFREPQRFLYSLNSFWLVVEAESAVKEKTGFSLPMAKADGVIGIHFMIKSAKYFLLLGYKMKREHLWKRNYTDESLTTGNETFSCCYNVAKNREM